MGLGAFVLYLATLAPTITTAYSSSDSGELVSAASVLGIAHPPGYGLYLVLARGALTLLAFLPEAAMRTNVLSALCGACAAAFTTLATDARATR